MILNYDPSDCLTPEQEAIFDAQAEEQARDDWLAEWAADFWSDEWATTTWTCDAQGNWRREERMLWRDETGWHDKPVQERKDAK